MIQIFLFLYFLCVGMANRDVAVRVEYKVCNVIGAPSFGDFVVDFPSVDSFIAQPITKTFSGYDTYTDVYFMEQYPSDIKLEADTDDSLCLSDIVINNDVITVPGEEIWLSTNCDALGGVSCQSHYTWLFAMVGAGIEQGVYVDVTLCNSEAAASLSTLYLIDFPSVPSFSAEYIPEAFSSPGETYDLEYGMKDLPYDIRFRAETGDGICVASMTVNGQPVPFPDGFVTLDMSCNSGDFCVQEYTWHYGNISSLTNSVYLYYHTCNFTNAETMDSNILVSFPSLSSFSPTQLSSEFSSRNAWFYEEYFVTSSPTDIYMDKLEGDGVCLDDIKSDTWYAMFLLDHVWLDEPCSAIGDLHYDSYCYGSFTWDIALYTESPTGYPTSAPSVSLAPTSPSGIPTSIPTAPSGVPTSYPTSPSGIPTSQPSSEEESTILDKLEHVITGFIISAFSFVVIASCGLVVFYIFVCCPSTRRFLGPLQDIKMYDISQGGITSSPLHLAATLNASSPPAISESEIDAKHKAAMKQAQDEIRELAKNDKDFLIARLDFRGSDILKLIEIVLAVINYHCKELLYS